MLGFKKNYIRVYFCSLLLQGGLLFGSANFLQKPDTLRDRCVKKGFVIPEIAIKEESGSNEIQKVEVPKLYPAQRWVSFPPVETPRVDTPRVDTFRVDIPRVDIPREEVYQVDCMTITVAIFFVTGSVILHPASRQFIGAQISQYL